MPQDTSSLRYISLRTCVQKKVKSGERLDVLMGAPLTTFPRAVFLKNLRCVTGVSGVGRFLIVISTIAVFRHMTRSFFDSIEHHDVPSQVLGYCRSRR
jgi:hypothetical protein